MTTFLIKLISNLTSERSGVAEKPLLLADGQQVLGNAPDLGNYGEVPDVVAELQGESDVT